MESVAYPKNSDGQNSAVPSKNALPRENLDGTARSQSRPGDKKIAVIRTPDGVLHPCQPGTRIEIVHVLDKEGGGGYLKISAYDRGQMNEVCTTPRECKISLSSESGC